MKYLAYFQSYTNTHDSIESLIEKYEEALSYPEVVGLIVGTRPDCMPDKLLNYFETLSKKTFVMIEYGVESTLNKTLDRVNRLHSYEESEYMIRKTAEKGLVVGAHMILGLPGETKDEILSHADKLSVLPLTSLKLHQLQIIKGTVMSREYRVNPSAFSLFELDDYINMCVSFSEKLNPDIYIERFTSQSPEKLLIAPEWGLKNYVVRDMIIKRFNEFKTYQGKLYKVHSESLI
jgi:radical SAM protein (TIGR01212 family)